LRTSVSPYFAGRALSFVARKDDLSNPRVTGFPSKATGLFTDAPTLIFRSDSNGRAVQVEPMKPVLKAPGTRRLKR
jgi:alpha-glucan,water dikinase